MTGPSGWRNSHIAWLYAAPTGPQAFLEWTTLWAQGQLNPWITALWSNALARPLSKTSEQRTARPIVCSEALLNSALDVSHCDSR